MRGGRRVGEGQGGAEVATAANINITRRREQVKVPDDTTKGSGPAGPDNARAHVYMQARIHQAHESRGPVCRIHCGVEVTELSTNPINNTLSHLDWLLSTHPSTHE
jgi:hypothetical protein